MFDYCYSIMILNNSVRNFMTSVSASFLNSFSDSFAGIAGRETLAEVDELSNILKIIV